MHKRDSSEKRPVLHLTAEQKGLIRYHTGRTLEALTLDDCGDRIVITKASESLVAQGKQGGQVLVLDLTGEQKRQLRRLTGKRFSQLRIHRRPG